MEEREEVQYRKNIQILFETIEEAFENVDPDVAECEDSMGALVITLAKESKCILSAQPSVRQLWLAVAARGTAYHFNYDPILASWLDDKGRGVEVKSFLKRYLKETTGLEIKI